MKYRYAILVAVLVFGVLGFAIPQPAQPVPNAVNEYRAMEATWRERFQTATIDDAYRAYLSEAATLPPDTAHTLAHIVGALLYERLGARGLSVCTADFSYGCYHGVAGNAVELGGISAMTSLMAACPDSARDDCLHGIGHGILSYYGNERVNDALKMCPERGHNQTVGCRAGVMMEYMRASLRKGEGKLLMPFDEHNPTKPCDGIAEEYKSVCYYELPSWWRAWGMVRNADYMQQIEFAGRLCADIEVVRLRTECFSGIEGQIAALAGSNKQKIESLCAQVPVAYRELCISKSTEAAEARFPGSDGAEEI
jgi:hypothetical protein